MVNCNGWVSSRVVVLFLGFGKTFVSTWLVLYFYGGVGGVCRYIRGGLESAALYAYVYAYVYVLRPLTEMDPWSC